MSGIMFAGDVQALNKESNLGSLCNRWGLPAYAAPNEMLQKISPEFAFDCLKFNPPPGLSPPRQRQPDTTEARSLRFAPKKRDLVSQFSNHSGPIVTLMIRNIPCRVTQQQLVDVIDAMGFGGKYDFLYLPTGGRSSTTGSSNLGYGFINFTDPDYAEPFTNCFQNFQFEGTSSTKVLTVRPAHIQGLENNILHFDRTTTKGRARDRGPIIRPNEIYKGFAVCSEMEEMNNLSP